MLPIIDCHNHSLPFIDDGAVDLAMALEMLRVAQDNGTTDIVLTPHHLNGAFSNQMKPTLEHLDSLKIEAKNAGININLHAGSEIHVVTETAHEILNNKALTYLGLKKAALLELPKNSLPMGVESILSELLYNGVTPIIAHPERNSALRNDSQPLKEWVELGCKAQLTGQSCTGEFGNSLQKVSFSFIEQALVHIIASDAHRPTGRSPNLQKAATVISETFGDSASKLLLHDNPKKLLAGEELINLDVRPNNHKIESKSERNKTRRKSKKRSLLQRLIDFK